jgi:hypothetical protein
VAVIGQIKQQVATDIPVPIVTIANISSIYVGSKSAGTIDPSLTRTGNIIMNPNPHPY